MGKPENQGTGRMCLISKDVAHLSLEVLEVLEVVHPHINSDPHGDHILAHIKPEPHGRIVSWLSIHGRTSEPGDSEPGDRQDKLDLQDDL